MGSGVAQLTWNIQALNPSPLVVQHVVEPSLHVVVRATIIQVVIIFTL